MQLQRLKESYFLTLEAKRKDNWRLKPGVLTTRFGKPIKVEEYGDLEVEEISELVRSRIETLIEA